MDGAKCDSGADGQGRCAGADASIAHGRDSGFGFQIKLVKLKYLFSVAGMMNMGGRNPGFWLRRPNSKIYCGSSVPMRTLNLG